MMRSQHVCWDLGKKEGNFCSGSLFDFHKHGVNVVSDFLLKRTLFFSIFITLEDSFLLFKFCIQFVLISVIFLSADSD